MLAIYHRKKKKKSSVDCSTSATFFCPSRITDELGLKDILLFPFFLFAFFNYRFWGDIFRNPSTNGSLKMFFFSVSDVLCAISDAANMNGCLVLHTPYPTLRNDRPQGEKRPCVISHGSWPISFQYRWPLSSKCSTHSPRLFWSFFIKKDDVW